MIFQEKFGSVRKGPGTFLGMFLLVKETKGVEQKSSENGALGRGQASPSKEITIFGNASATVRLIPRQGEPDQCQPRKIGTA